MAAVIANWGPLLFILRGNAKWRLGMQTIIASVFPKISMKRYFLSFMILTLGCNSSQVDELDQTIVAYQDLPTEVKQQIFKVSYIEINEPKRYVKKTKKELLFPWVYNVIIERVNDGRVFKTSGLKGEYESTYVIYDDFLFIPNHFNISPSDSLSYTFTRFDLK
ncbi:hypothetical protein [Mangrovimonas sp. YM274]|uniref:hypothetical protein n=1 Tax=Mangrovimonas sp. YM274 TaxID=3070660 RepID=UPI0027DC1FC8|nr:hypothetical protein [Mangrovimonas sp. YM274]WMI70397.1 hypothetical protein RBH95_02805 [Mangrovimonas sp. YM274]